MRERTDVNPRELHRQGGISIIELLVVMAILGIILVFLGVFFAQSARISQETQARNEVRTKVRTIAEIVAQDLQLAGSSALVTSSGGVDPTVASCSALASPLCIEGASGNVTSEKDYVAVRYATSLRNEAEGQCRKVRYTFDEAAAPGTLLRADNACSETDANKLKPLPFADNITKLQIQYLCADYDAAGAGIDPNAMPVDLPQDCYAPSRASFPRQAIVTVAGRADAARPENPITAQVTMTAIMPNLKDR